MNQTIIDQAVSDGAIMTCGQDHALYSVNPPETLFGYLYFSHMIPPTKPETVLILGYGAGTVDKLIKKVWGNDIKVTGVDQEAFEVGVMEVPTFLVRVDAFAYLKDCALPVFKKRFDYVVVDLWNGYEVPDFLFIREFPKMLAQVVKNRVCLNVPKPKAELLDMYQNYGFLYERHDVIDNNCTMFFRKVNKDNES